MLIKVVGRDVGLDMVRAGVEGDHRVTDLIFVGLPEMDNPVVTLHWTTGEAGDIVALDRVAQGWRYEVTDALTQYGGAQISAYLQVVSGEQRWHSNAFVLRVNNLPGVDATVMPPEPSVIDQMIAMVQQGRQEMSDALIELGEGVDAVGAVLVEVEGLADQVGEDAQGVAADRDATHGYMVRAEVAATEAAESAASVSAIDAEATGLEAGSAPTAEITSDEDGMHLALGIPAGAAGATGATGPQGPPGSDAEVTSENVRTALGYVPADDAGVVHYGADDGKTDAQKTQARGNIGAVGPTDYASGSKGGVVKTDGSAGIYTNSAGTLRFLSASDAEISARSSPYKPIVPANLDYAVKSGVTTNTLTMTDAEKTAACGWMGAVRDGRMELIEKIIVGYNVTTEQPADWATNWTAYFTRSGDPTSESMAYVAVTGDVAPAWTAVTYYSYDSSGVTNVIRMSKTDGTAYNADDAYMSFYIPENTAIGTITCKYYSGTINIYNTYVYHSNNTRSSMAISYVYRIGGRYDGCWTNTTPAAVNSASLQAGPYYALTYGDSMGITRISIVKSSILPSGSVIKIYMRVIA